MGRNSGNADERPIKWTTVSDSCTNHGCMAQMVAGNMIATQCGLDKLSYLRELDSALLPGFFQVVTMAVAASQRRKLLWWKDLPGEMGLKILQT